MLAKTVLLIDDDVNLTEIVRLTLKHEGFSVLSASNGKEGLALAAGKKPDLVILDVNMPVMDGWDTLGQIRGLKATQKIPVLMLTTQGLVGDVDRAMQLGATSYIVKPFDMKRFIEKVKSLLATDS